MEMKHLWNDSKIKYLKAFELSLTLVYEIRWCSIKYLLEWIKLLLVFAIRFAVIHDLNKSPDLNESQLLCKPITFPVVLYFGENRPHFACNNWLGRIFMHDPKCLDTNYFSFNHYLITWRGFLVVSNKELAVLHLWFYSTSTTWAISIYNVFSKISSHP